MMVQTKLFDEVMKEMPEGASWINKKKIEFAVRKTIDKVLARVNKWSRRYYSGTPEEVSLLKKEIIGGKL